MLYDKIYGRLRKVQAGGILWVDTEREIAFAVRMVNRLRRQSNISVKVKDSVKAGRAALEPQLGSSERGE